jgi:hypothetical protein
MSERSMGSEFDRKRVDGNGEQRRQQNEQSNQAGGQQGSSGGSLGAGPMTSAHDAGLEAGALSRDNQQMQGRHPGPDDEGLANQENQGRAQADPAKSVGPQRVKPAGGDRDAQRGGSANRPGDANGSGSMGSTRRDDPPRAPQR